MELSINITDVSTHLHNYKLQVLNDNQGMLHRATFMRGLRGGDGVEGGWRRC